MRVALWCPSLGLVCGVGQYTSELAEHLPEAFLTTEPPAPGTADIVHMQHEPGIFPPEGVVAYALQNLRNAGMKVVVTEHTIQPRAPLFEQFAHGLVALSRGGAATLRARSSDRPVEWIDLHCRPWRGPAAGERPRDPGAERVIGAHGFLWYDKGFFELVDALRGREDTRLLLYSHPRIPTLAEAFAKHIEGTNTTWVREHVPLDTVIADLAARADALVYWRRPWGADFGSASVRTGLVTGVPVLTSRTTVFDDLGEAVYRPESLEEGLEDLLTMPDLRSAKTALARRFVETNSGPAQAEKHRRLYEYLLEN